uniref:Uncharacterized protein n=1 Tax=Cucumis melo TaxID=3656 RepID=A0A9I9EGD2_CUCME
MTTHFIYRLMPTSKATSELKPPFVFGRSYIDVDVIKVVKTNIKVAFGFSSNVVVCIRPCPIFSASEFGSSTTKSRKSPENTESKLEAYMTKNFKLGKEKGNFWCCRRTKIEWSNCGFYEQQENSFGCLLANILIYRYGQFNGSKFVSIAPYSNYSFEFSSTEILDSKRSGKNSPKEPADS